MAKIDKLNVESSEILWSDRKRILGMPISFTKYSISSLMDFGVPDKNPSSAISYSGQHS